MKKGSRLDDLGGGTILTERMTFQQTLLYSLSNAASLLTYWTFNTYVVFFYTDVKGVKPEWIGLGWFAFGFWNAVNDPIAGWLSDRTNTRWGRRRFYIGALAVPTSIAFACVWLPPIADGENTALLIYFLVIISIYDMLQSVITLNQDALFPEMYQETSERAGGSSARQLIGFVLGAGLAISVSPVIYDSPLGWPGLAVIWGVFAAGMYFASLKGIREDPAFASQEGMGWRDQIQLVFSNRTFLIVLGVHFMMRFILAALLVVLPYYGKYVLGIEDRQLSILTTALFVTSGASVLVWQYVVRRQGTRKTMIYSMVIGAVLASPLLLTSSLAASGVVLALLGTAVGGTIIGPDLLFAELIDEDFVKTGQRREGMYRGILGFVYRFPPAVAGLLLTLGLALAGYKGNLDEVGDMQPAAVETVIRVFVVVLPLIGLGIGVILLWIYPLYGKYLDNIQERAAALRHEISRSKSARGG